MWSTSKYKATHQGNLAFHSPTRPAVYNSTISEDEKPSVVRKKEATWNACVNNYKLFDKATLEACALILHAVDKMWFLELKDEETLFTHVTQGQLMDHLQSICGGMHAIDVLTLQNEMQYYHKDSEGILKYINILKAAPENLSVARLITQSRTITSSLSRKTQCRKQACTCEPWTSGKIWTWTHKHGTRGRWPTRPPI